MLLLVSPTRAAGSKVFLHSEIRLFNLIQRKKATTYPQHVACCRGLSAGRNTGNGIFHQPSSLSVPVHFRSERRNPERRPRDVFRPLHRTTAEVSHPTIGRGNSSSASPYCSLKKYTLAQLQANGFKQSYRNFLPPAFHTRLPWPSAYPRTWRPPPGSSLRPVLHSSESSGRRRCPQTWRCLPKHDRFPTGVSIPSRTWNWHRNRGRRSLGKVSPLRRTIGRETLAGWRRKIVDCFLIPLPNFSQSSVD